MNLLFQRSPLDGHLRVVRQAQIDSTLNRLPLFIKRLPVSDVLFGKAA